MPKVFSTPPSRSSEPKIGDLIPRKGLFPQYVARAIRITDAPPVYHVGALLGALSAAVAPWARMYARSDGRESRRPMNLWVVLCGEPDNRKSYSVDLATEIFAPWIAKRSYRPSGSKQGIEDVLWEHPHTFFPIREAPQFLADNRRSWMANGSAFWCEVFDGFLRRRLLSEKDGKRRRKKDSACEDAVVLNATEERKCVVTMLLAGATEGLLQETKRTDWTAGFMSRMMVLSAGRGRQWEEGFDWPERDKKFLQSEVTKIVGATQLSPDVTRDQDAKEIYSAWFSEVSGSLDGLDLGVRSIVSRLRRHISVVAGLYALSCGQSVIDGDSMRAAVGLGRWSHRSVLRLPLRIR